MTSAIIPFMLSMLLGRTIDLRTYSTGGNIYDDADYVENPINRISTSYAVLQSNTYPYTYLGLPVDLVLRLKANFIYSSSGALGLEGLLKDTAWKANSAIVAVVTTSTTVQRTLKGDAKLLPSWQEKIPKSMTHYVNSMIYGGWSITLFRFKCKIQGDVPPVRDTITSILGVRGDFSNKTVGLFHTALEAIHNNPEVRGKVTIQARTYSNHPSKSVIDMPNDLQNFIAKFPEEVGQQGKPLYMEVLPLKELDSKYTDVKESHKLDAKLEEVDELYDDVRSTKFLMTVWLSETLTVLTEEQEAKLTALFAHLNACIKAFHVVAESASVYSEMSEKAIESALQLYIKGLEVGALSYEQVFRRYKEELDVQCEETFLPKVNGLLKVLDNESLTLGKVEDGLEECQAKCIAEPKCRAIGYADYMATLELVDGNVGKYVIVKKEKLCWIYFRSTSTAAVTSPKGISKVGVYDRQCY
ncbi:uncharacterized protein LOC129222260 [Uloborus diversus]|uniref:uncharacterized protein LOC129222260 n=1 Tax=Uloborus diversus TaxID=327109 RepID=UPI0024093A80|nr:uncharacterized protein LOC129222260 [Uloborus diversus]